MLCYQSSRTVADTVRDAIQWLVANRRVWVYIGLPVLVACGVALMLVCPELEIDSHFDFWNLIGSQFDDDEWLGMYVADNVTGMAYFVMSAAVALMLTPYLHCYFVNRTAVRGITGREAFDIFMKNLSRALWTAIIWGCSMMAMMCLNFFLGVIVYLIGMIVAPCVMMGASVTRLDFRSRPLYILGAMLSIYIVGFVIRAMPILCWELICVIIDFGGSSTGMDITFETLSYLLSALQTLAFTASVAMMLVASVLLHGSMYKV